MREITALLRLTPAPAAEKLLDVGAESVQTPRLSFVESSALAVGAPLVVEVRGLENRLAMRSI